MRAEMKWISPNDFINWESFVSSDRREQEVWDDFGWFSLDIGSEGEDGTETFQVLVSTPAAVSRAKGDRKRFRGIIVDEFKPDIIRKSLTDYVSSVVGISWSEVVEQLRRWMYWEYEEMSGH
jgi:hypothetical protein